MEKVILFMGDSITDCSRNRELDYCRGYGYVTMATGVLTAREPYTCYNRGISGDRIVDVYARMRKDLINLKPDYLSILLGVNGVWHECMYQNGVSAEKFEMVYELMLTEHGAVFVPLQEIFTKLEATAPAEGYWLYDGVHPTAAGHEIIKQEWLKAFEKIKQRRNRMQLRLRLSNIKLIHSNQQGNQRHRIR